MKFELTIGNLSDEYELAVWAESDEDRGTLDYHRVANIKDALPPEFLRPLEALGTVKSPETIRRSVGTATRVYVDRRTLSAFLADADGVGLTREEADEAGKLLGSFAKVATALGPDRVKQLRTCVLSPDAENKWGGIAGADGTIELEIARGTPHLDTILHEVGHVLSDHAADGTPEHTAGVQRAGTRAMNLLTHGSIYSGDRGRDQRAFTLAVRAVDRLHDILTRRGTGNRDGFMQYAKTAAGYRRLAEIAVNKKIKLERVPVKPRIGEVYVATFNDEDTARRAAVTIAAGQHVGPVRALDITRASRGDRAWRYRQMWIVPFVPRSRPDHLNPDARNLDGPVTSHGYTFYFNERGAKRVLGVVYFDDDSDSLIVQLKSAGLVR